MSEIVFTTERLIVRRWRDSDLDALLEVYGDAEAMRWVGDGTAITRDECIRWMEVTRNNYRERGYGMFVMETRISPQVIGFCGLVHPGGQVEPEIKYALRRSCWGFGYATEAAIKILQYGAEIHGLHHIIATVAPENRVSQRVLLKAGMERGSPRTNPDGSQTLLFHWRNAQGRS